MKARLTTVILMLISAVTLAQVPVDDDGNVVGRNAAQSDIMKVGEAGIPLLSHTELQELVGPIALYPDDLLAIALPAAAYPLQIVEAARFLEALKNDSTLKPDPDWDDSVVALTNYPEVIELLNEDLDWTLRLGEAVVAQQSDVIAAVESFRDRAYAAGNLKSDAYQTVSRDEGVIYISPTAEDVIYVPYYEPARVVYYQPRPVYYYYPRAYPVYYYPYSAGHYFDHGFFWGVTTAFTIGWHSDSLHIYHHSYLGHPYYGHSYWDHHWYRRPSISVYNTYYASNTNVTVNRQTHGDRWSASSTRRAYVRREGYSRTDRHSANRTQVRDTQYARDTQYEPITFRERDARVTPRSQNQSGRVGRTRPADQQDRRHQSEITFRDRPQQRQATGHSLDTQRQQPRDRTQVTHRQNPVVRSRDTHRQEPVRQSRERAPVRTEHAPVRTERAPAPQQHRQAQTRQHEQRSARPQPSRSQPSRSQPSRSQPSRSQPSGSHESRSQASGHSAEKSRSHSSDNRDRSRDRQH